MINNPKVFTTSNVISNGTSLFHHYDFSLPQFSLCTGISTTVALQLLPPKYSANLLNLGCTLASDVSWSKEPNQQKLSLLEWNTFYPSITSADPIPLSTELLPYLCCLPHQGKYYSWLHIRSNILTQYITVACHCFTDNRLLLPCSFKVDLSWECPEHALDMSCTWQNDLKSHNSVSCWDIWILVWWSLCECRPPIHQPMSKKLLNFSLLVNFWTIRTFTNQAHE